jgi:hypothetical protein
VFAPEHLDYDSEELTDRRHRDFLSWGLMPEVGTTQAFVRAAQIIHPIGSAGNDSIARLPSART